MLASQLCDAEGKAVEEVARAGDGIKQPPSALNLRSSQTAQGPDSLKNLDLEDRRIAHLDLVILWTRTFGFFLCRLYKSKLPSAQGHF